MATAVTSSEEVVHCDSSNFSNDGERYLRGSQIFAFADEALGSARRFSRPRRSKSAVRTVKPGDTAYVDYDGSTISSLNYCHEDTKNRNRNDPYQNSYSTSTSYSNYGSGSSSYQDYETASSCKNNRNYDASSVYAQTDKSEISDWSKSIVRSSQSDSFESTEHEIPVARSPSSYSRTVSFDSSEYTIDSPKSYSFATSTQSCSAVKTPITFSFEPPDNETLAIKASKSFSVDVDVSIIKTPKSSSYKAGHGNSHSNHSGKTTTPESFSTESIDVNVSIIRTPRGFSYKKEHDIFHSNSSGKLTTPESFSTGCKDTDFSVIRTPKGCSYEAEYDISHSNPSRQATTPKSFSTGFIDTGFSVIRNPEGFSCKNEHDISQSSPSGKATNPKSFTTGIIDTDVSVIRAPRRFSYKRENDISHSNPTRQTTTPKSFSTGFIDTDVSVIRTLGGFSCEEDHEISQLGSSGKATTPKSFSTGFIDTDVSVIRTPKGRSYEAEYDTSLPNPSRARSVWSSGLNIQNNPPQRSSSVSTGSFPNTSLSGEVRYNYVPSGDSYVIRCRPHQVVMTEYQTASIRPVSFNRWSILSSGPSDKGSRGPVYGDSRVPVNPRVSLTSTRGSTDAGYQSEGLSSNSEAVPLCQMRRRPQ